MLECVNQGRVGSAVVANAKLNSSNAHRGKAPEPGSDVILAGHYPGKGPSKTARKGARKTVTVPISNNGSNLRFCFTMTVHILIK